MANGTTTLFTPMYDLNAMAAAKPPEPEKWRQTMANFRQMATLIGNSTINNGLQPPAAGSLLVGNGTAWTTLPANAANGIPLVSRGVNVAPAYGAALVLGGGTGRTNLTGHTVLVGANTANVTLVAPGNTGIPLVSTGATTDPAFGTANVPGGGTGLTTLTNHAVLIGQAAANVVFAAPGATGIPLVSTGASSDPAFGTANVPGGGTGLATLTANGVLFGNGTANAGVTAAGTADQVLVTPNPAGAPLFSTVNIASNAAVTGNLAVTHGGTSLANLTTHNLLIGNNTGAVTLLPPSATTGVPLVSQGASADPAYGTAVVAGGGTGAATLAIHGVVIGNATGPVNITAAGTTGQVLTGVTGADPVFAASSGLGFARDPMTVRSVTNAGTTAASTDDIFLCDATLGAATVTLPAVIIGHRFRLYKTDATVNPAAFAAGGGDTINGTTGTTVQSTAVEVVGATATTWHGVGLT